jgi:hypothetical protein
MTYRFPNYPPIETSADNSAQAHLDWLKDLIDMVEVLQWMFCREIGGRLQNKDSGVFAYGTTGSDSLKVVATIPATMKVVLMVGAGFVDTVPFRASQQTSEDLVAPLSAPRIDTVAVDALTGALVIYTGDEAESPVAPSVEADKLKLAEIHHKVGEECVMNSENDNHGHIVDSRVILNP